MQAVVLLPVQVKNPNARSKTASPQADLQSLNTIAVGRQCHVDPQRHQGPRQENSAQRPIRLGTRRIRVGDVEASDDQDSRLLRRRQTSTSCDEIVQACREEIVNRISSQPAIGDIFLDQVANSCQLCIHHGRASLNK
jgi:hypothetical protein